MSLLEDIFGKPFFGSSAFASKSDTSSLDDTRTADAIRISTTIFNGPKLIVYNGKLYRITAEEMEVACVKPKQKSEGL